MPALPVVASTVRVDFEFVVGPDINVRQRLFYNYTGGVPNTATLNSFATEFLTQADANFGPVTLPTTTLRQLQITDLASTSGARGTAGPGNPGTRTGGLLPAGVTALCNYAINRRYRGGKPRGYWPFGSDTDLATTQEWTTAALADFNAALIGFVGATSDSTFDGTTIVSPVNVSYYDGFTSVQSPTTHRWRNIPTVRAVVPTPDAITAYAFSLIPGSQRRRYQR